MNAINNFWDVRNEFDFVAPTTTLKESLAKSYEYLKNKTEPCNINELQSLVWKQSTDLETHTVETHIYRLRKKILKAFKDENFIMSEKNGYKIN